MTESIDKVKHNPVSNVQWVSIDKVEPNDYNPNAVATNELRLLAVSIDHDGYTQPVVTIYDKERDKYVIVDGFHRYFVMKTNQKIFDKNGGLLPIVVLDKGINDRMASTIRHNRARGKHSVHGMGNIIFEMINNGASDAQICNELGLEVDELIRLKHVTGVAKLFKDREFSKAWEEDQQVKVRLGIDEKEPKKEKSK